MPNDGPEQPPSPPEPDPTQAGGTDEGPLLPMFGHYQLHEIIGRGGMGEVYRAFDSSRGRIVALKRLPTSLAADPTFQARFRTEAALAARLHEPHVIPIHDFGEIDGQLYIDMRLVEGPDLAHLLTESGPLPAQRVVDIITQVATALDAAHSAGLVHRDIKPGNVLVVGPKGETPSDFVYVADFGIARAVDGSNSGSLTSTGATVGSMDYVAPERFEGGHGDRRADVYALGCVLYEALTAQRPFPVDGLPAIINAHLNTAPPAPSARRAGLPVGLDAVVARAMAKNPDDRYQSAGALAADARRALEGDTIGAGSTGPDWRAQAAASYPADAPTYVVDPLYAAPPPLPPLPARPPRRRRNVTILAAVATVLVLVGAIVTTQLIKPSSSTVAVTEPGAGNGINPFMPSITTQPPTVVAPVATGGTVGGGTSGLYGGTLNIASCDPAKMVAFLQSHPEKGSAWADVEGISPAAIPTYVAGLTPVLLRADTAVTNHGFANDAATTLHSVLQAGTAVLVDRYGVPRARCACGNPLTPSTLVNPTDYTGDRWAAFNPANVVTIAPSPTPIAQLILVDPVSLAVFTRPVGGNGRSDQVQTPTATPTSPLVPSSAPNTDPPPQISVQPLPPPPVPQPSSDPGNPTQPQPEPPGPAQNLVGTPHNDSGSWHIDLSWAPPDDLHGDDLVGYQITSQSPADPLTTTVTTTRFLDTDEGRNCARDRTYTVRVIGRPAGGGDEIMSDGVSIKVPPLLDCTPDIKILSATAAGNQVTVTIQCSGGGRGGLTHSDLAVQLDGDEKWTGACSFRLGGGAVGSSQYTAVIDNVDTGDHAVTATSSTISGTNTAGPTSVTVA